MLKTKQEGRGRFGHPETTPGYAPAMYNRTSTTCDTSIKQSGAKKRAGRPEDNKYNKHSTSNKANDKLFSHYVDEFMENGNNLGIDLLESIEAQIYTNL